MTRERCEAVIAGLMKCIVKAYKQYNPKGKYLSLAYVDDTCSVFNEYWPDGFGNGDAGADCDKPLVLNFRLKKQEM